MLPESSGWSLLDWCKQMFKHNIILGYPRYYFLTTKSQYWPKLKCPNSVFTNKATISDNIPLQKNITGRQLAVENQHFSHIFT
jgi:hypothetical protein